MFSYCVIVAVRDSFIHGGRAQTASRTHLPLACVAVCSFPYPCSVAESGVPLPPVCTLIRTALSISYESNEMNGF